MRWPRRRGPTRFQRAADGSMTLAEHFRELRERLFKASLGVLAGFLVGLLVMQDVRRFLSRPYCRALTDLDQSGCAFTQLGPLDLFLLDLKIALGLGVVLSSPVWLYQLWAFVAPGLHRRERRWAYAFAGTAAPLFLAGAMLAFFVLERLLGFLLGLAGDDVTSQLEVTRYVSFVVTMMLTAGLAFQFPLVVIMLNVTGVASARRLLGWWRGAVFAMFVLAALITPTPEPFTLVALGLILSGLYFAAVGVAFLLDRRRARRAALEPAVPDDVASPLEDAPAPARQAVPGGPRTAPDRAQLSDGGPVPPAALDDTT